MSIESNGNLDLEWQVEQVFGDIDGKTTRQRIQIASFVLGDAVIGLREAKERQLEAFAEYTKNTEPAETQVVQLFGVIAVFVPPTQPSQNMPPEFSTAPSDVEHAEKALQQSLAQARETYDLKRRHINKALRMSRRTYR